MISRAETREHWEKLVYEYRFSGQGVTEWCKDRNIRPQQLWNWLRKFKIAETTTGLTHSKWVSFELGNHVTQSPTKVLLIKIGHAIVEVQPGFDSALLSQVVRSLSAV